MFQDGWKEKVVLGMTKFKSRLASRLCPFDWLITTALLHIDDISEYSNQWVNTIDYSATRAQT